MKESVEVLRDSWRIPILQAKAADNLFFAQGFIAAQDRLFTIDLRRRVGVGETPKRPSSGSKSRGAEAELAPLYLRASLPVIATVPFRMRS